MTPVRFLQPAEAEVDEAVEYFDQQRDGLGDRFLRDLQTTTAFIAERPRSGKPLTPTVRKARLRTFQYNVIYVIDSGEIVIVAVAHHRRRPGYWRSRLATVPRN